MNVEKLGHKYNMQGDGMDMENMICIYLCFVSPIHRYTYIIQCKNIDMGQKYDTYV